MKELNITFRPSGRTVYVLPGTVLLEAAARAGLIIDTPCGGIGTCTKCLVRVISGNCVPCGRESELLDTEQVEQGYRLACQCSVTEDMEVEVPFSSLLESESKILSSDSGKGIQTARGNSQDSGYGVAFDVGTTTIVGTLIDLSSGAELAVSGGINPQTSFGDDVISRIKKCIDDKDGLEQMNRAVLGGVHAVLDDITREAGVEAGSISRAAFAGNTAMQEILCNINPRGLGEIPFTPAFTEPRHEKAGELGLAISPGADVFVFPQIGGFVGGDTVAGIIATRLEKQAGPVFFIDIGTNGELVLAHEGRLTAASTAAGPAFEGARIIDGMRAATGAIEKVIINEEVRINVIGNVKPRGLCGSALIDVSAELLRLGVIDNMGRILAPGELPGEVPESLRGRLVEDDGHYNFTLVDGPETATGRPICLYQRDVRELQLANGAVRAGICILLKMNRLSASDLQTVLVAGAFGNFIRRSNAVRIGLLPRIPNERIRFVGNTASFGAKLALLSEEEQKYAAWVGTETTHIDLSSDPEFQAEFGSAMIFP